MRLYSDACLSGWGAVCLDLKTGGPWSGSEVGRYFNNLEILAAYKALECFASLLPNCTVKIEIDNTTAVSYINKLGGCQSKDLCDVSLRIANFCEESKIFLTAIFVPGIDNVRGSRIEALPLGWRLEAYSDSFNVHLPAVASPSGPFCVRMEPPTTPIRKLVPKTKMLESGRIQLSMEAARRVLFSPIQLDPILPVEADIGRGRGSICHPVLAEPTMAVAVPRLLQPSPDLLTSPLGESHLLVQDDSIRLIVWKLSGSALLRTEFQKTLQPLSSPQHERIQKLHTRALGIFGEIGVLRGKRIPCLLAPQI